MSRATQLRRQAGKCVTCGGDRDDDYQTCSKCRSDLRMKAKLKYAQDRKNGVCRYCNLEAELGRATCKKCREEHEKKAKEGRDLLVKNGLCKNCRNPLTKGGTSRVLCECCRIKARKANKEDQQENRLLVISAYGGACSCCGERELPFLSIDHIKNDGAKHRKEIGGSQVYRWIIKNGYPKDRFRVLCHNCNVGRQLNKGVCPHEALRMKGIKHG